MSKTSSLVTVTPAREPQAEIDETLAGCWGSDTWDLSQDKFGIASAQSRVTATIEFAPLPPSVRREMKFFLAHRLKEAFIGAASARDYARTFTGLGSFLHEQYPSVRSIAEVGLQRGLLAYRSFLTARDVKPIPQHLKVFRLFCSFMEDFYDTRPEFEKDVWNFRKIPGARYSKSTARHTLNFTSIPTQFRDLTKRFIRAHIATRSFGFCQFYLAKLACFFDFVHRTEPSWKDLRALSRDHIERFLARLVSEPWKGRTPSVRYRFDLLMVLRGFLEYIQCADYPEAPTTPVTRLLHRGDMPRFPEHPDSDIKFIPEEVLSQLEEHLCHLTPPRHIPVVILLRATGWRISDILDLRYDTCLVHKPTGWWLRGDIPKTGLLGHEVPITEEVAAVVLAAKELAEKHSTPENNPEKFLFPRLRGVRKGLPYEVRRMERALNALARRCNIVDAEGKLFRFRSHAFRHTKGIELINNGMNILHVQKWMGHASPRMTMTYARILDTTLRAEWERAFANGAVRISPTGTVHQVSLKEILDENEIEWEWIRHNLDAVRLPNGYCFKSQKTTCHAQLVPCYACRSFCTTIDFLPQLEREAAETHQIIDRGRVQGMTHWVEKNEQKLQALERVIATLKAGKTHQPAGKAAREYVGGERRHVR